MDVNFDKILLLKKIGSTTMSDLKNQDALKTIRDMLTAELRKPKSERDPDYVRQVVKLYNQSKQIRQQIKEVFERLGMEMEEKNYNFIEN